MHRRIYQTKDAAGRTRFYSQMTYGVLSGPISAEDKTCAVMFHGCRVVQVERQADGKFASKSA